MDYTLTKLEIKILNSLDSRKTIQELAQKLNENVDKISKYCLFLSNKGYVKLTKKLEEKVVPTEKGEKYLREELPEDKLIKKLPCNIKDLDKELLAPIGYLKSKGYVTIENGEIKLISEYSPRTEYFRKCIKENIFDEEFAKRGLIKKISKETFEVEITEKGKEILKEIRDIDFVEKLTKDLIVSGKWKKVKLRWYDVESPLPKITGGRKHPLKEFIKYIQEILIGMGFEEIEGPWVETAFWNFDSMFQPQDHPARDVLDTIYIKNPKYGDLPEIYKKVKEVHEKYYKTPWDENEARKLILRSHVTAASFRKIASKLKIPGKYFCIDRVFRNETIDWKHLAEFHQIEGFIVGNVNLRHLMGFMKEFYSNFGISKLRFKPTYNPYTEPSLEIFGWYERRKSWVEIGNSGMFRPESLEPYGIKHRIIAWGLALERLFMLVYDVEDIRKVWGSEQ